MQICPKCKIKIRGTKECCPLWQAQLKETEGDPNPSFPIIRKKPISNITFLKVCTFLFVAVEIVFISINMMTRGEYAFISPIILGFLVGWLTILTTMYLRNNLIKVLTWEVLIAILVDIYIDIHTGQRALSWSVEWMVPLTLIALAVATIIIAAIMKLRLDEYILYLVFDLVIALLQIIFIRNGTNEFPWPAVISIMIYLILLAAVVIFRFRDLRNASEKMFNM